MPPLAKGGGDTWTTPLAGSHSAIIFGDTASQTSTMHSVDRGKEVVDDKPIDLRPATKAPVHRRGSSFRGLLKIQVPPTIADHGSIDVDSYATNHDELVTSLIDEALKLPLVDTSSSASNGDASKEMESEGGNASLKNSRHSPLRRSITRQLGSPLKRHRSSVTANADSNRSIKKLHRGDSNTSGSKVPSHVSSASSFLHPDCVLRKEKAEQQNKMQITFGRQNSKQQSPPNCTPPAAVGREETLAKLSEKLSMLGEIESGKFGQAAEMRRSDAVSFLLAPEPQQKGHRHGNNLSSLPTKHHKQSIKVETRSLLSLKMGFVSMNYGILLVWNTDCKLVEMVVLRKMCRDDFLLQGSSPASTGSVADGDKACHKRSPSTSSTHTSMNQTKRLSPLRESRTQSSNRHHVESSGQGSRREGNRAGRPNPTLNRVGSAISNMVPRFLSGSDSKSQSYLSVSVVNVKNLHGGCEHCRSPETSSPKSWSMFDGSSPNFALNTSHRKSTTKRKHPTVRPYVRFILGDNEHATKVAKYNKGNPKFSKRHYNSCLLPCPPEELRWFAGQDDLVVEVRNNWVHSPIGGQCDDPLLATVTVPLSSVNLEDEGGSGAFWTKRRTKSSKGGNSTNVTLPLRMTCCPVAPLGSINLQITIKVPKPEDCPTTVSSTVAKSNIEEFVDDSTGDLQVSESIELGPITRLIDGLTFCQSEPCSADIACISTEFPLARGPSQSNSLGSPSKTIRRLRSLRWSKYYDPTTRRWSALQKSPTSVGESTTSRRSLSCSSRSHSSGQKLVSSTSASRDEEGWFTFLR